MMNGEGYSFFLQCLYSGGRGGDTHTMKNIGWVTTPSSASPDTEESIKDHTGDAHL